MPDPVPPPSDRSGPWPDPPRPAAGLTDRLRAGASRPSTRLWTARLVDAGLVGVPVTAGGSVAGWVLAGWPVGVGVLVGLGLLDALVLAALRGRYRSWAYQEQGDDLVICRGLLIQRLSIVPYGRMQFIDVTAGPIERMLGLATVKLHTAAAATDARIPGLDRPEADGLRDRLAALGEATATGL